MMMVMMDLVGASGVCGGGGVAAFLYYGWEPGPMVGDGEDVRGSAEWAKPRARSPVTTYGGIPCIRSGGDVAETAVRVGARCCGLLDGAGQQHRIGA
ncbi:hypothetical protein ZWY2020_017730 [Hordeum vulgare]|nr:hypothetical protein ZWY2020_017730 [Hordeum vulgare]